ncbi:MAG: ABC transporter permease [Candidatus Odinarchaeum yellowstonii]|uniref:ABC transporter permease n=1 Tax=Odinarchaeota yellowstonii (strain LCB_4) TaxID=1841599 RepID=A0AAF0D2G3_ODILC|nr:MAG: ABC transporter permease [Candidatus Odinarchaeum yellowstonii]
MSDSDVSSEYKRLDESRFHVAVEDLTLRMVERTRFQRFLDFLSRLKNPLTIIGIIIVAALIFAAVLAPFIAPYNPIAVDLSSKNLPPSLDHLFGTDGFGRDIFSRILYGAQISLFVGIVSVLGAVAVGVPLGIFSAYRGGYIDTLIMRVMDIMLAFPSIILAIAIAMVIGAGIHAVTIAILVVSIPIYARIARGSALSVIQETYIEAARAIGAPAIRIIFRHILPNILAPILVEMTLDIGSAVLSLAGLSFLGLGAPPPYTYDWGRMISDNFSYQAVTRYWWQLTFPGLAIVFCVLGWNLLGDGLRDAMDPKLRLKISKQAKKIIKEMKLKKRANTRKTVGEVS